MTPETIKAVHKVYGAVARKSGLRANSASAWLSQAREALQREAQDTATVTEVMPLSTEVGVAQTAAKGSADSRENNTREVQTVAEESSVAVQADQVTVGDLVRINMKRKAAWHDRVGKIVRFSADRAKVQFTDSSSHVFRKYSFVKEPSASPAVSAGAQAMAQDGHGEKAKPDAEAAKAEAMAAIFGKKVKKDGSEFDSS